MKSNEIVEFFQAFPQLNKFFLGVFSIDTLPQKIAINE